MYKRKLVTWRIKYTILPHLTFTSFTRLTTFNFTELVILVNQKEFQADERGDGNVKVCLFFVLLHARCWCFVSDGFLVDKLSAVSLVSSKPNTGVVLASNGPLAVQATLPPHYTQHLFLFCVVHATEVGSASQAMRSCLNALEELEGGCEM